MINLTVIEMKDIIKYLVRITIIIVVVVSLTRYFSSFKAIIKNQSINIREKPFLSCMDIVIPGIKIEESKLDIKNNVNPLKMALDIELKMADTIEKNKDYSKEEYGKNNLDPKEEDISNNLETEIAEDELELELQEAKIGLETEVQENSVPQKFTNVYGTVKIKNETKMGLTEEMLNPDISINTKNIIIYHTHTCESYTQSEKYTYEASGNFRTTDKERSVVRVGEELSNYMKKYGYSVIHDTTFYDYPSYSGSYDRSLANIQKILDSNKESEVLFDIHRDAIADSTYAPKVKIGDEYAAQIMFVIRK